MQDVCATPIRLRSRDVYEQPFAPGTVFDYVRGYRGSFEPFSPAGKVTPLDPGGLRNTSEFFHYA